MIPGELFPAAGEIEINAGRPTVTLTVSNTGDRPIQVGSHYHFYETNAALAFDREQARGSGGFNILGWLRSRLTTRNEKRYARRRNRG